MDERKLEALRQISTPEKFPEIARRFAVVVSRSFHEERERSPLALPSNVKTDEAEMKRRVDLCYERFMTMRVDCHLSTERSLDELPLALRAAIDGTPWEPPPADRAWSAAS